jgi:hypothetical protein
MGLQTVRHTAQLDWSNALSLYCNTKFNITQISPPCCHKYNLVDIPFALTQTFHCTIFTTSNINLQQTPKGPHLISAMDFMFCGFKDYFFCQPCLPKWLFTRATAFFQGLSHYPRHPYGFWTLVYTLLC